MQNKGKEKDEREDRMRCMHTVEEKLVYKVIAEGDI